MRFAKWELIREQYQFDVHTLEEKVGEQKVLGRGGKNRVCCDSEFVSRKHCCITYRNGAFHLKDLESTNGTFLNGHKLALNHDRELREGDLIGLGIANIQDCPTDQYFVFRFVKAGKPFPTDKIKTEPAPPAVPQVPVLTNGDGEDTRNVSGSEKKKELPMPNHSSNGITSISSLSLPSSSTKVGILQQVMIPPEPPKSTPRTEDPSPLSSSVNKEKSGRLEISTGVQHIKKEIGATKLAPINIESPSTASDSKSKIKPPAVVVAGKLIKVVKAEPEQSQRQPQPKIPAIASNPEPESVTSDQNADITSGPSRPKPGPLCSKLGTRSPAKTPTKLPISEQRVSESTEKSVAEMQTHLCSPRESPAHHKASKAAKSPVEVEIVSISSSSSDDSGDELPPQVKDTSTDDRIKNIFLTRAKNIEDQRKGNHANTTGSSTNQKKRVSPTGKSDSTHSSNKFVKMSGDKDKNSGGISNGTANANGPSSSVELSRKIQTTIEKLEKVKQQALKIKADAQQELKELQFTKKGQKRSAPDFKEGERESKRMRPIPSWVGRPLPDLVPTPTPRTSSIQPQPSDTSEAARPQNTSKAVQPPPRKAIMIKTNYAPGYKERHGLPSLNPLKRAASDTSIPGDKTGAANSSKKLDTSLPTKQTSSKPACGIKSVSNSRADKLASSLTKETPAVKHVHKNGALPPVSSAVAALMPVMQIMNDMSKPNPTIEDSRPLMAPPPPPASTAVRPKINMNFYKDLKKTAPPRRVPGQHSSAPNDTDKSAGTGTVAGISSSAGTSRSRSDGQSFTLAEEVYRQVLEWNTTWLIEQQKVKVSPPVYGSKKLVTNLSVFVDYASYIDTLYPLMMLELWASVYQEYFRPNRHRASERSWGRCTYDVLVEKVESKEHCPMLPPLDKAAKRSLLGLGAPLKPFWHCIKLCTPTETKDLNKSNDFGILTVNILKGGTKVSRSVFGFFLTESENYDDIKTHPIGEQQKLFPSNPNYKYKYTVTFVTRLKEYHDVVKTNLGKVERFAYISAKMRDFRAMSILPTSKLFEQIIHSTTPDISEVYQPGGVVNVAGLVKDTLDLLNPVQRGVVQYISGRVARPGSDLLLVHGPPGTGKTRTIVGLVLQLLKDNKSKTSKPKLLICTPSNGAIDEIIRRLDVALGTAFKIVRVGQGGPDVKKYHLEELSKAHCSGAGQLESIKAAINLTDTKIKSLNEQLTGLDPTIPNDTLIGALQREICDLKSKKRQYHADFDKTKNNKKALDRAKIELLQRADVVCSTLSSCCNSFVRKHMVHQRDKNAPPVFTCCILDEATQATEPESLSPLLLNIEKLILVGDPMQLPATVISTEAEAKLFNQSLFARLYNFYESQPVNPVMMLTVQYRMNEEILHWPNMRFYRNKLTTSSSVKTDPSRELRLKPYLFLNVNGQEAVNANRQFSNAVEVRLIKEILLTIKRQTSLHPNHANLSIGIITPYYEQRVKLLALVDEFKETDKDFSSTIEVDTVDSFQGREKDIILLSCVRTEELGFLRTPQRLNVSLTRAKMCLYIIGNATCLNADSMWKCLMDDAVSRGLYVTIPDDDPVNPAKFGQIIEKCLIRQNLPAS